MKSFVKRRIFSNSKNPAASYVFLVLCAYTVVISSYTLIFYDVRTMIIRLFLCVLMATVFVAVEKSSLSAEVSAFLSPTVIAAILTFGAIYFNGDGLFFIYLSCITLISLSYFNALAVAAHIIIVGLAVLVLLLFNINLLGKNFTMVYNFISFAASLGMNALIYSFCSFYAKTLDALTESQKEVSFNAAKLNAVLSNYGGIIWSIDTQDNIVSFNGLYLKKLGVTPEFLEGKKLSIAKKKNRHLDIIENVQKTLSGEAQEWISDIDGKKFLARTVPMYDENGNVYGVVGSADDLTEIITLQERLEEALKNAEAASMAKSTFLANMSHEIRTPMNAIVGMTSIGAGSGDTARMKYCFEKISDASKHLLGVINDILDISKIESGKFELSFTQFSFEHMLKRAVTVNNFRIDEKQQVLSIYVDKLIPRFLYGDDQRLAQVITNFLSNAVKFTPEKGNISIDAKFGGEEDGLCTIQISVTDTGIGISAEQQSKLFKSFQQADASTSRKFGGTGLGLAISKNIIELMGGNVWIESELGKGASFMFAVKLKRGIEKHTTPPDWRGIRILAVDDDPAVLEYFKEIASGCGAKCEVAPDAKKALELAAQNGFNDVFFVDWQMPEVDGIELTRQLKSLKKDLKVVMISSGELSTIEEIAKTAGVDKFVPKPLFPSDVVDAVNELLVKEHGESSEDSDDDITDIFKNRHILLADDVEINREIVQALLEPTRLNIDCAENGVQAVSMFSENPDKYDMIFMDVQMPGMDGYAATRAIRESSLPRAKTIPIIAMTANVFKEDVEMCLNAGMNDHIGKPLDFDMALSKLRTYLP